LNFIGLLSLSILHWLPLLTCFIGLLHAISLDFIDLRVLLAILPSHRVPSLALSVSLYPLAS
jgi:hypothetical protein